MGIIEIVVGHMDVPESIMLAVLLICGILQVILFFKIWGMTNNVKRIYSSVADINIVKEIHKHNPDIERLLFDETYNRLLSVYKVESEKTSELFEQTKSKCKMLYAKAGIKFPEVFESIDNKSDWERNFSLEGFLE